MARDRKKRKKKKYRGFWVFVRIQIVLILLVLGGLVYYFGGGYAAQVDSMRTEAGQFVKDSTEDTFRMAQTSIVYDANGNQISTLKGEKDLYYLAFDEIPANVKAAIVSIEDKKFYKHEGIDYKAIIRAAWAMIRDGEVSQGGSTITQQLARTVFLSNERTWQRKMEEIFIAMELEKKYDKEQILEFYLNNIYFGNGYYGIQAASRGYFNKDVNQLTLSQTAYLCAIPNNPTLYDPFTNGTNTLARRDRILDQMLEENTIVRSACVEAKEEAIVLEVPKKPKKYDFVETYTYYCATRALMETEGFEFRRDFATEEEEQSYDDAYRQKYGECQQMLFTGGYRIYTSIDLNMEEMLQKAVDNKLSEYTEVNDEGVYMLQGAAVCIDNETGCVKAIVGGRDQKLEGHVLNRAYQSYRQPGSAIKPLIVYTPLLERGYTADTVVTDAPIEDGPSNANGIYLGDVTLRYAVEHSVNTVAWNLFAELTPATGLAYLEHMNFNRLSESDERLPAALGGFTEGVSPVEMAAAYAAIENDGNYRAPTCVTKILRADGSVVYEAGQEETAVYKTNAARQMTDILEGVVTVGTAKGLALTNTACAGKTGTTNSNKDGWFVGYTKYYTTSVWVGYDIPRELPGLSGSGYPAQIWNEFMQPLHEGFPYADFVDPLGITQEEPADEAEPADETESADEEEDTVNDEAAEQEER